MKHFWNLMDVFFTLLILLEDEQEVEDVSIAYIR